MKVLVLVIFVLVSLPLSLAILRVGFYDTSCPQAESIVRQAVQDRLGVDNSVTAALVRMYFHDCFVRGCDASILIDSTSTNQTEKDAFANLTVRGYELIDLIKFNLEITCPQTVSCADIIALATRDSVALAGGPQYNIPTGRRDGLISRADEVDLPGPASTVSQAQQAFRTRGMTINDMVVLLGGHSIGVTHCSFFQDRLTNFQGTGGPDPTMDPDLVTDLTNTCGSDPNSDPTVFLDENSSFVLDNEYYNQIMNNRGLLEIDQELALDRSTSGIAQRLAADNALFGQSFAKAMVKLGSLQVLEGNAGEIRTNCRMFNEPA